VTDHPDEAPANDCVFCAIAAGRAPAQVVDEDADTMAFLDIAPFTPGHTLVIPKRHTDDFWSVDAGTAAAVMRTAHRVADRMRAALDPDGLNLLQATRAVAFQTVFHLHVHVIPRWVGDTMSMPDWPKPAATPDELAAMARRLGA
jgi:histidine triad (HIT) family protein